MTYAHISHCEACVELDSPDLSSKKWSICRYGTAPFCPVLSLCRNLAPAACSVTVSGLPRAARVLTRQTAQYNSSTVAFDHLGLVNLSKVSTEKATVLRKLIKQVCVRFLTVDSTCCIRWLLAKYVVDTCRKRKRRSREFEPTMAAPSASLTASDACCSDHLAGSNQLASLRAFIKWLF